MLLGLGFQGWCPHVAYPSGLETHKECSRNCQDLSPDRGAICKALSARKVSVRRTMPADDGTIFR